MATATAAMLLGLAGCTTTPQDTTPVKAIQPVQVSNAELLQRAGTAIERGEFGNARQYLQQLQQRNLTNSERIEQWLVATVLALKSGQPDDAEQSLQQLQSLRDQATPSQDSRISLLRATLYGQRGEHYAAVQERVFIAPLLQGSLANSNHEAIWGQLMAMSEEELADKRAENTGSVLGQWIELALLSRHSSLSVDEQLASLALWRRQNPTHPAALQLPGSLAYLTQLANQRPERVALMLPLSGPLAASGEAIRDGFLAAYYQAIATEQPTPEVTLIDSQGVDSISQGYAEALMSGAQWVVGPVSKQEVVALEQRQDLAIPTLALNYGDPAADNEATTSANLYQFGLAPEDDAIQAANQAWADGHRRALVMIPEGSWGERIFTAFRDHWEALGGVLGETRFYTQQNDYNPDIKALLNVDDSVNRNRKMRQLLRQTTEFEPRRRQDIDWVFLVAQPQQARQIKPTLAFNFAVDLPVYATSHVYSGHNDTDHDRDLDGIRFCDLPWVLEGGPLYDQVEQNSDNGQGPYLRLYALGVDAYRLLPRLPQLQAFPNSRLEGETGVIQLDAERRVHRQSVCAIFRDGRPVLLSQE
ncbi:MULTISPECIES: penicillin-binding protein activator [unclassified Oceanobacter]|uniref:penicillin-binding protein activator n=1 Tax=unclassified Oceanobacter TaxID=2620260 RepID=UPI002735135A|nr:MULTISPECIES: penicillin-binding protein activator [unclassified Oceanobacter]MDP2506343.1 penicillin-binding protein activator [Oceanobacter sp. 3_MG-2023]MDP2546396.1 penicillin-binding protein activator [Oceanobacter sp. 4_MG-2023]MDP2610003.1 penicillin-binding protein activator [Oceanobacter sp. 1_MG-2023]MDP2613273.1 penicillin-binding protein activator [Oceanobacter sp. 2_MG-2023]